MRALIVVLAALVMAAPAAQAQIKNGATDKGATSGEGGWDNGEVTYVRRGDPDLAAAIAEARRTLPNFFTHLARPAPGEHSFVIKYNLLPEPGEAEYIWAEVVSHSPGITIARLANVPFDPRFKLGEKVTVRDDEIMDWGYYSDGVMQGHFSTRSMMPRYDPADAEAIRRAFNW